MPRAKLSSIINILQQRAQPNDDVQQIISGVKVVIPNPVPSSKTIQINGFFQTPDQSFIKINIQSRFRKSSIVSIDWYSPQKT